MWYSKPCGFVLIGLLSPAGFAAFSIAGVGCSSGSSGSGGPGGVGGTSAGGTSGQGGGGGTTGGGSYASRRSPTCKAALSSMCDHLADRCMEMTRTECDGQFGALFCLDDRLPACTGALPNASCGDGLPDECNGVGDGAPATQFCNEFVDKLCAQAVQCDPSGGTKQECIAQGQHADRLLGSDRRPGERRSMSQRRTDPPVLSHGFARELPKRLAVVGRVHAAQTAGARHVRRACAVQRRHRGVGATVLKSQP